MSLSLHHSTLSSVFAAHGEALAQSEGLSLEAVHSGITNGTLVLLGNPAHSGGTPLLVGQPSRVKINANIGTSPMRNSLSDELEKLAIALACGADTIMDLSIAGDLAAIRKQMLAACPNPIGTVPLYAVAQKYIAAQKDPALFSPTELFEEIEAQAEQGVGSRETRLESNLAIPQTGRPRQASAF